MINHENATDGYLIGLWTNGLLPRSERLEAVRELSRRGFQIADDGEVTPPASRKDDPINHPSHYTGHPSGVECIQITEHMNFCRGNAMKYIWRAGEKGDELEDLKKARWYLDREIARLSAT